MKHVYQLLLVLASLVLFFAVPSSLSASEFPLNLPSATINTSSTCGSGSSSCAPSFTSGAFTLGDCDTFGICGLQSSGMNVGSPTALPSVSWYITDGDYGPITFLANGVVKMPSSNNFAFELGDGALGDYIIGGIDFTSWLTAGNGDTLLFGIVDVTEWAVSSRTGDSVFGNPPGLTSLYFELDLSCRASPCVVLGDPDVTSASAIISSSSLTSGTPPSSATPEPSTLLLLGSGLLGVAPFVRRGFARA